MSDLEYYEDGVFLYQGLPDDIDSLSSYQAIQNITTPPLDSGQCLDLLRSLFAKRFSVFYNTGLGKTLVASAFMKALKNNDRNSKALFIGTPSQIYETAKKITKASGLKCSVFDGSSNKFVSTAILDSCDVIVMSSMALLNEEQMERLLFVMPEIKCIVADEIHLLSNLEEGKSAFMLYSLSKRVEYFLGLTATPITTNIEQFCRVLKIVNPLEVGNFKKLTSTIKIYGLNGLEAKYLDMFTIRDRPNIRKGFSIFMDPMPHQIGAKGKSLFELTKGKGSVRQVTTLVNLIRDKKPFKGLVYVFHKSVYEYLEEILPKYNIRFESINGSTSKQDRVEIMERFRNNELDVILTNVKEALDMDSDYVVFYEFTPHVKQMIGRVERGLNPKAIEVYFMFTRQTDEYDYFIRNVYNISQDIQDIMGIDYHEVLDLKEYK